MAILMIFWSIFGDRMANLGLIDFKIGLYIKVNVTAGQNCYQLAQNRPDATLAHGHCLPITWSFFIQF